MKVSRWTARFPALCGKAKGIYVPSFYDVAYNEDGTVAAVVANCDAAPAAVEKRVISDMNTVNYPTAPIVPFGEIVHDRIMLEVFRGCSRGCRFCHAGMVYVLCVNAGRSF